MSNEMHIGDIGSVIRITVKDAGVAVDISSASTKQILLEKPDGTILTKTAQFLTTGADGVIQYTTIAGDLDVAGIWRAQAYIVSATWSGHSSPYQFTVFANVPDSGDSVDLITLADAKAYLKVTSTADDGIIKSLISSVSAWAQGYLNRNLVNTSYVEYYSGDGSCSLLLRNSPIIAVTSINIDSLRVFGSSTLVASSNYLVKKSSGILESFYLLGNWTPGSSNIKVSYSAGYVVGTTMPHDIRMAVRRIVDHQYRIGYTHRKLDYKSESIESMNVSFKEDAIPKDAQSMLDPYRNLMPSPQFEYAD